MLIVVYVLGEFIVGISISLEVWGIGLTVTDDVSLRRGIVYRTNSALYQGSPAIDN